MVDDRTSLSELDLTADERETLTGLGIDDVESFALASKAGLETGDRSILGREVGRTGRRTRARTSARDALSGSQTENDFEQATELHTERSARARRQDEARAAPITTDYDTWASDPDHYDFLGVDTPDNLLKNTSSQETFSPARGPDTLDDLR